MKNKITRLTKLLFLIIVLLGCEKDDDEWIGIEAYQPEGQVIQLLDQVISNENNCLINFESDTLVSIINTSSDFNAFDNCHEISQFNFNDYTLVLGKVKVNSISDKIGSILLFSDGNHYKIDITIERCTACYGAIGHLYFWQIYPKLGNRNIKIIVN